MTWISPACGPDRFLHPGAMDAPRTCWLRFGCCLAQYTFWL